MKKTTVVLLVGTLIFLNGCKKSSLEVVHTVDWYEGHEAERKAVLERCEDDPGELAKTPNCINASNAAQSLVWSSSRGIHVEPLTAEDLKKAME